MIHSMRMMGVYPSFCEETWETLVIWDFCDDDGVIEGMRQMRKEEISSEETTWVWEMRYHYHSIEERSMM